MKEIRVNDAVISFGESKSFSVAVGTPAVIEGPPPYHEMDAMTLQVTPGESGSTDVHFRVSRDSAWTAWPAGTVTAVTTYRVEGVQAIRVTANTAATAVGIC